MEEQLLFGMKDFYDVTLKTTYPITIDKTVINEGEVIARFDKIHIATISEQKREWVAHGGYDDRGLVYWQETKAANFQFSNGVFNKRQLALMTNTKLLTSKEQQRLEIPVTEYLESDGDGQIQLKYAPIEDSIQVHEVKTGKRLPYTIEQEVIQLQSEYVYTDVIIDYYIKYDNKMITYQLGEQLIDGFLRVEGKTRLKDDSTGNTVTGILTIPRLKLKSGLSMRLGDNASPITNSFQGEGLPVGLRGDKTTATLVILSDDIDSDF